MKTRTPVSSVILYIFGIIFMIVAAFMLWTAIEYTKMYLASYDTTFEEMWSNSVQYIIEKFLPYFAAGVICIGLGKAISVFRKALGARQIVGTPSDGVKPDAGKSVMAADQDEISMSLRELREVGSIKLEELERREKVRLDDMRETVIRDMALHRLQREAKEEEIISKLNAMGEKMGLDMVDLYAKADIPVVPDYDEREPEERDMIGDDPLFEELDKVEAPTKGQIEETEATEPVAEEAADVTERAEPVAEEAADVTEQAEPVAEETSEEPEAVSEPVDEESAEETSEETEEAHEEEPAVEEESADENLEQEQNEEQSEEVSEEQKSDNQVLTHNDEPGTPEQIETEPESSEAVAETKEETEGEPAEDVKDEAGEEKPDKPQKPSNKKSKKQKKHKKKKKK